MLNTSLEEKPLHPSASGGKEFGGTGMPGDLMFWGALSLLPHEHAFVDHNLKSLSAGFITIYD